MSVLVCLLVRVFLGGDLLPFVWLGMGEEEGEAGLMSGVLFVFSALQALLAPSSRIYSTVVKISTLVCYFVGDCE